MIKDIRYDSHKLFYKNPFGALECESKVEIKIEVLKSLNPSSVILNFLTDTGDSTQIDLEIDGTNDDYNIYSKTIDIPSQIGLYWYNFTIQTDKETLYYGNNIEMMGGQGEVYKNDPPSYQITVHKRKNTTVDWIKDGIMYQIFPDRFYNGNEDKTVLKSHRDMILRSDWNDTPRYLKGEQGNVEYFDYFGGNLMGIIKKLPYLKELGVTIIYLNPIFEGESNHKYDTGDYKKIDAMFGDKDLFVELCEKSKDLGIRIILDGVFSHTGSDSIYFNKNGNYDSLGAYQSKDSKYFDWYDFKNHPDDYDSWWGVDALPNVDELNQSYLDYIINDEDSVVNYWSKLGISGWRLDVADELPDEFIRQFKKQMKVVDPDSVLIGEVWEDASNKSAYDERRSYLLGEELDSTMNYPFRKSFIEFCLGDIDSKMVNKEIMKLYENYPLDHFYSLMNLVGTHDRSRIITVLGQAPDEGELSQSEREDFKLEQDKLDLSIKRLKLISLMQMTLPGVPSIYYGDEVGVEGYSDPINRRTYPWGNENQEILDWFKKITKVRTDYDVFKTGAFTLLDLDPDVFGFTRQIKDSKDVFKRDKENNFALVLINRSDKEIDIKVDLDNDTKKLYNLLEDKELDTSDGSVNIKLPSFGHLTFIKNK